MASHTRAISRIVSGIALAAVTVIPSADLRATETPEPVAMSSFEGTASCNVQLERPTYHIGESIYMHLQFVNHLDSQLPIEVKLWVDGPDGQQASILRAGSEGTIALPPGFNMVFGPRFLFAPNYAFESGSYSISCSFVSPVTGELLARSQPAVFTIP